MRLCEAHRCTGCMACYNACMYSAIDMYEDKYGELHPVINEASCVGCGRCTAACPILGRVTFREPLECYAAWTRDESDRGVCSSGGIATLLAREMISRGGVVFGAAFDESLRLCHSMADSLEETQRFRKSKYVLSEVGFCYRQVRSQLRAGRVVLFIGCPCQVAGLNSFLSAPHDGLVTVDLVCHGAPPGRYLSEHLTHIIGTTEGVTDVSFRDDGAFRFRVSRGGYVAYAESKFMDPYYYAFLNGVSYRESCYECAFAQGARCSDITLGDFWGLDRSTLDEDDGARISLVLLNTVPGKRFFDSLAEVPHAERRDVAEAFAGNPQLRHPSSKHRLRAAFRAAYPTLGFIGALRESGVMRERLLVAAKESRSVRWLRSLRHSVGQRGDRHDTQAMS